MKILQVLPELNSGGVEKGTLEVAARLVAEGEESLVMSAGGRMVAELEAAGTRHLQLPVHRKSLFSLRLVPRLRKIFREEGIDVVHARSRIPAWLVFLAWRGMPEGERPVFMTTVHGFNSVNAYSRVMTFGERVICVSESVRSFVLGNYPATDAGKLQVIHRGVDPAEFHPEFRPSPDWLEAWERDFPEAKGKRLFTLPGRVTRLKGHVDFLEILAALDDPTVHGVIAGGTDPRKQAYQEELAAVVRERGLQGRVTFTGRRSDLREILADSELVFSLTTKPESFGRTALEALALGRPLIGYDHGGVGEILTACFPEGRCPPRDTDAAVNLVKKLLTATPPIRNTESFTLDAMLDGIVGCYRELLEG